MKRFIPELKPGYGIAKKIALVCKMRNRISENYVLFV
jgi:hypothetical protein